MPLTRRTFLELSATTSASLAIAGRRSFAFASLAPTVEVENPLSVYPNRGWEKVYLDQYRYDATSTWVCSPNCTHECRMRGFLRNGVLIRSEQNYDNHRIADLYGNVATAAWNPRGCSNGFTYQRRVYGPYRLKGPIVRQGWKSWADAGFPELSPALKSKYKFDDRGNDEWVKVSWDQALDYAARGFIAIATRYSGDEGKKRLLSQGYPEEMLTHWEGAGTRTCKLRGGMGLLGVMGKYGMYRFANMLAIMDTHIRGVEPKDAKGGRNWSNYTWHGDQAPGHPFVHGLQASDCDFNDLRHTKLHVQIGKNLVENKRPDSHFFIETMERGAKIVVVSPEYSPPATKSDYWISVRPNADTALLLGIAKILIDNKWYDADFVKKFTDFPLLVRLDNGKRLLAKDLFKGYQDADLDETATHKVLHLHPEERAIVPDHVVFDEKSGKHVALCHADVGEVLDTKGLSPALEGKWTLDLADGSRVEVSTLFSLYKDVHLKDYDVDSVVEMTAAPKELVLRLAKDIATIKPVAIHVGEGLNHWFHATEMNRAAYLPVILTGNVGKPGAGSHTWAGNYKAALFQGAEGVGPGFKGWVAEIPSTRISIPPPTARTSCPSPTARTRSRPTGTTGEKPSSSQHPKDGRKCFTGQDPHAEPHQRSGSPT
ncbi:MAG: molybdopterin-dependent oxidoreductase [Acidobacteriota bacterium]